MGMAMVPPETLSDIEIRLVALDETFALRKAVLRPWLTRADARAAYDGLEEHFQVGALRGGRLVSTAGFVIDTHPDYREAPFGPLQWRLRGMATEPAQQGQGLGGRVVAFGIEEIARRLSAAGQTQATLWCNGRTGAQTFYQRCGFAPLGKVFETPGTGPHYVFWRNVDAA